MQTRWRATLAAAMWLGLAFTAGAACGRAPDNARPHATAAAERHRLTGQVVGVDVEHQQLTIRHARVVGYMEGMTMPFHVPDRAAIRAAEPGSHVEATLVVEGDRSWLEGLTLTSGDRDGDVPLLKAGAQPGDEVPDFTLMNQDRRPLSLKQLRGKAVALTFIYTRCPLPDFCPLIAKHFAAAERLLRAAPALRRETALVSVTFDPDFDTPEVLAKYRASFLGVADRASGDHWQCATGSADEIKAIAAFFGLLYSPGSGQISHSLRTVIIRPDGHIARVHPVNDWTPEGLVGELKDALRASKGSRRER